MRFLTRSALVCLGLSTIAPQVALAAPALGSDSEIVLVDGEVSGTYSTHAKFSHGVTCEADIDGETYDCEYISLETDDNVYTDYLFIDDFCETGRYCNDGTLMAMKVIHTINWNGDSAEMESDIWLTKNNRMRNVGAVYSDVTVGEGEVSMDIALLTGSWTDLGTFTFDRDTDPSDPDALSWTNALAGAMGGAGVGASLGGVPGAAAGAVLGAGLAVAAEILDENSEGNEGGDDGDDAEGGEGSDGEASGGDVASEPGGTCDPVSAG